MIFHDRKEKLPAFEFRAGAAGCETVLVGAAHGRKVWVGCHREVLATEFRVHFVMDGPEPAGQTLLAHAGLERQLLHVAAETEAAEFTG